MTTHASCLRPVSYGFSSCLSSAPASNAWFSGSSACDPAITASERHCPGEFVGGIPDSCITLAVGRHGRHVVPQQLLVHGLDQVLSAPLAAGGTPPLEDIATRSAHLIATRSSTGVIVFDLTSASEGLVEVNKAFKAAVDAGTYPLKTNYLHVTRPRAARIRVSNKGCHNVYVLAADSCSSTACKVTIGGVKRSIGVRPRESTEFMFDPTTNRWCVVGRAPVF